MFTKTLLTSAAFLGALVATPAFASTITVQISEIDIGTGAVAPISATGTNSASIATSGPFGGFTTYTQTATGVDGSTPNLNLLDLNGAAALFAPGSIPTRSLAIEVVESGLTAPFSGTGIASMITGTLDAGARLLYKTYFDATNTVTVNSAPGTRGTQLVNLTLNGTGSPFSQTIDTPVTSPTSGSYSLAEFFYITEGPGGSSTFNGALMNYPVPEPATLALLGAAVLGVAGVARRRHG